MTTQSGGTVSGYPGVASDGADGLIADGGIQTNGGDPTEIPTDGTPFNALAGATFLSDTTEVVANGWGVLQVSALKPLQFNSGTPALLVYRHGALNGFDYTVAPLQVFDNTGGTGPLLQLLTEAGVLLVVNHAGGVGQYGHAPPTAQPTPTIATSTITDAVAKAAIKALILIINNSGEAAITET